MKRVIGILLLATSCTVSQPSETKEDSVATLSNETLDVGNGDSSAMAPVDTVFNPVQIINRVTKPGIIKNAFYVYHKDGLDIVDDGKVVGHADYKAMVMKLEMQGELVLIDFDGITGVVSEDYLLPLPVPEVEDITEYFLGTLMLTKDPVERKSPESNGDDMFSFIDYEFETGFKVYTGSQYESGYTSVKLPGLTLQQAFLFASYFYESFGESLKQFPTEAREEDLPEEKHISVKTNGNTITGITVSNGEGCYWEDSISATSDGVMMNSSGGC